MSRPPKRPPTLTYALERLECFTIDPYAFRAATYNRSEKPRLMRLERRQNIQKVLTVLVRHVDLVTGRIVRPLGHNANLAVFADCSLSWLCHAASVSRRTLCRVLADLADIGWLHRTTQKIIPAERDMIAVATVIRSLTDRFFAALGLDKDFRRDRQYLQGKRRARKMVTLFRVICLAKKILPKRETRPCSTPAPHHTAERSDVEKWLKHQQEEAHATWWKKIRTPT